jgi:hypothetical protein
MEVGRACSTKQGQRFSGGAKGFSDRGLAGDFCLQQSQHFFKLVWIGVFVAAAFAIWLASMQHQPCGKTSSRLQPKTRDRSTRFPIDGMLRPIEQRVKG